MTTGDKQAEFKTEIKQWLKSHGLDYRWVAEQCGVSEITVRNWMSKKNIPPLKQQLLERVMIQLPAQAETEQQDNIAGIEVTANLNLTIRLTPEHYTRLTERAQAQKTTPEAIVTQAIRELIDATAQDTPVRLRNRKIILPDS